MFGLAGGSPLHGGTGTCTLPRLVASRSIVHVGLICLYSVEAGANLIQVLLDEDRLTFSIFLSQKPSP